MLASDKTASLAEPRHNHLVRRQVIQADGGGNNIYDGIDRSYLVKMHLIARHTVRFCFCFCKNLENPLCQSSRSRCQDVYKRQACIFCRSSVCRIKPRKEGIAGTEKERYTVYRICLT